MSRIDIELVEDLGEAARLWAVFSPDHSIYESWSFRSTFRKYFRTEPRFYVASVDGRPVALLPLQYNHEIEALEFFGDEGSNYMEDNRIFFEEGFGWVCPELCAALPKGASLRYITGGDPFTTGLPVFDHKYVLDIGKYSCVDDYLLDCYSSKSRHGLKKRLRKVEDELAPVVTSNDLARIEDLFRLNVEAMGERSYFLDPFRPEIFRDLLTAGPRPDVVTLLVDDRPEAVSLSFEHAGQYFFLQSGVNKEAFSDLGNYLVMKCLERAIALGCHTFDAGSGNFNWKERFHLRKKPQYELVVA